MGFQKPEPELGHGNLVVKISSLGAAKPIQRGGSADLTIASHSASASLLHSHCPPFQPAYLSHSPCQIAYHYDRGKPTCTPFSSLHVLRAPFSPLQDF